MKDGGRPRRLLLGALAFLGLGAGNVPAQIARQTSKDTITLAKLPETKQQPGRTVQERHGFRTYRSNRFIWLGRQKRGNRRGRSHWDYNR